MRMLLCLLMLLASLSAGAGVIKVSGMSLEPEMETSFILRSNLQEQVMLDCQSFVQGLYVGPRQNGDLLMLDPQECQELYLRIKNSIQHLQKHCIDAEDYIRSDYSC